MADHLDHRRVDVQVTTRIPMPRTFRSQLPQVDSRPQIRPGANRQFLQPPTRPVAKGEQTRDRAMLVALVLSLAVPRTIQSEKASPSAMSLRSTRAGTRESQSDQIGAEIPPPCAAAVASRVEEFSTDPFCSPWPSDVAHDVKRDVRSGYVCGFSEDVDGLSEPIVDDHVAFGILRVRIHDSDHVRVPC